MIECEDFSGETRNDEAAEQSSPDILNYIKVSGGKVESIALLFFQPIIDNIKYLN